MKVDLGKSGELSRAQVWTATWIAVATSSNCNRISVPTEWADTCLREFDKRFPGEAKSGEKANG